MTSFGDTKLRSLGDYFASNLSRGADPMWQGWKRIWNSYRAKYVTCKNAKLTPFLHVVFLSIALNYAIDYQHLKGEVQMGLKRGLTIMLFQECSPSEERPSLPVHFTIALFSHGNPVAVPKRVIDKDP